MSSPGPEPRVDGVRPARPHTGLTPEGNRVREVLSYSRRGSRMGPRMTQAWERHRHEWWIPDEVVDDPGFELRSWFGREAPLVVQIGCGANGPEDPVDFAVARAVVGAGRRGHVRGGDVGRDGLFAR